MSDDHIHEFDLDAWEAPAPSSGFADGVIARAREAAPAAAIDPAPARSRRWMLAAGAGVLVAAAAVGTVIVLGGRHAAPASGSVEAARAQRLDLDSVSAELDSGADVRWSRRGSTLAVEQPRGAASWRVGDDHLEITSGPTTIDASGASLRVEVHMQLSDARVIGASTLTSAAVAFVTVIVYEGHVAVHSAGQTVNVEPGATVEVRPGQPPAPPSLVGDDEVERLQRKLDDLQNRVEQLRVGGGTQPPAPPPPPPPAPPAPPAPTLDALDRAQISDGIAHVKDRVLACGDNNPAQGIVKVHMKVAPDGKVTEVTITQTPEPKLAVCVADVLRAATFAPTKTGGTFSYPFVFEKHDVAYDPFASAHGATVKCDATALEDAARQDEAYGQHASALQKMEKAIACAPNQHRYQFAFMVACNAKNVGKSKYYYPLMGESRHTLVQLCVRNGISVDTLEAGMIAQGYAQISSTPEAKVLVDGKDTGLTTPVAAHQLPLTPGKHKITFMVGEDKYTYPISVVGGEVVTLTKDLH